jgi:Methyltransferase domain
MFSRRKPDNKTDLTDLGPLYHDYSLFSAKNLQLPGVYASNQSAKSPILLAYIQLALAKSKTTPSTEVSFTELFCADGYYAMAARHLGAARSIGIDNNRDGHLDKAPLIAQRLGLTNVEFRKADIADLPNFESTDIVANLGGLYHVSDPKKVLQQSCALTKRFLIVQTVYSLASTAPDYFETPAPGWQWGSRFSLAWLDTQIASLGAHVIDHHTNILEANTRLEDRGSAYYLLEKSPRF